MSGRSSTPTTPHIRCAIYTRKSSEEGLDQEFNSLDAQRESGEAYIASQKNEGWVCLPTKYDDGGFTGGNMERPALRRLMNDIAAGVVDCVVVYKVDRLSRSLTDFVKMMEVYDRHKVSFVSVMLSPSVLGATRNHPMLWHAIRDLPHSVLVYRGVWDQSGPGFLTRVVRDHGHFRDVVPFHWAIFEQGEEAAKAHGGAFGFVTGKTAEAAA